MTDTPGRHLSPLVWVAASIAYMAHRGQYRRDQITPYIKHVEAVANAVRGEDEITQAAAWLHDVIEDTTVTYEELRNLGIPQRVLLFVELLTREKTESYEDFIGFIASAGGRVVRIKIADILHNMHDDPTDKQREKYQDALERLLPRQDG